MSALTIADVRAYVWDRTIADNALDMKLAFTDAEILQGMKWAAREYNSFPPVCFRVCESSLPGDTNMFLDGCMVGLYLAKMSMMQRNDMDYKAAGTAVELEKKQIEYMTKMLQLHQERFKEAARQFKRYININQAVGRVG